MATQALEVAEPLEDAGLDPGPEMAPPRWEMGPGSSDKQQVLAGKSGLEGTGKGGEFTWGPGSSVREMRGEAGSKQRALEWKGAGGQGTQIENRGWCGTVDREQG